MLYPSIDKLLDIVDSKYSLVVAASKSQLDPYVMVRSPI